MDTSSKTDEGCRGISFWIERSCWMRPLPSRLHQKLCVAQKEKSHDDGEGKGNEEGSRVILTRKELETIVKMMAKEAEEGEKGEGADAEEIPLKYGRMGG